MRLPASPPRALAARMDAGRIAEGKAADLVVLDGSLQMLATYVDGVQQEQPKLL